MLGNMRRDWTFCNKCQLQVVDDPIDTFKFMRICFLGCFDFYSLLLSRLIFSVNRIILGKDIILRREGMKKNIIMIIVFLVICTAILLPAGLQKAQLQQTTQQKKFNTELIELRAKVNHLEKELEMMKRVIKINGPNVDIKTAGSIKIRGASVLVEAVATAQLKGSMVTVQASGINTIQGKLVKIN